MLVIRLQRRGRRNLVQYRVIVQDSRFSTASGKVVETLGSYDPHTKKSQIDVEAAKKYLKNGAQPSARVQKILKEHKVTLPSWVKKPTKKEGKVKKSKKKEEVAVPAKPEDVVAENTGEVSEEQPEEPTLPNTEAKEVVDNNAIDSEAVE